MNKEIFFYNLCDMGISYRMIQKLISSGITPENILTMNLVKFGEIYGVKKEDFFYKAKELAQNCDYDINKLSVYSLVHYGLSTAIIDNIINAGIDKAIYLYLCPENILKSKFGLSDLNVERAIKAVNLMNLEDIINYDSLEVINFIASIETDPNYIKALKVHILEVLQKSDDSISHFQLLSALPKIFSQDEIVTDVIMELIKDKSLECDAFGYKKHIMNIDEFMATLPESIEKEFMLLYLSGNTYEQIGILYGITRERVRQRLGKIKFPKLKEDYLVDFYNEYKFVEDTFCKIFSTTKSVFQYVQYRSKKCGIKTLDELLKDPRIDENVVAIIETINPKYVYINGVKYPKSVRALFEYFASRYMIEPLTKKEVMIRFKDFWEEVIKEPFNQREGTLDNIMNGKEQICILSKKKTWRYYDFDMLENSTFYSELSLEEYRNKEVSVLLIYNDNRELMLLYDIRDEYELHNIMRKSNRFSYIDFGRIPMVPFDDADRKTQVEELLIELSPVSQNKLIDEYFRRYGHNKKSALSYITKEFGKYFDNGVFDMNLPIMDDELISKWKALLTKEFYFHDEINQIAQKNNLSFEKYYFNKVNLAKLGFASNNSYIYSNKYPGANFYFNKILSGDLVDLEGVNSKILSMSLFNNILSEKIANMELFEYSKRKYISIRKLNENGITEDMLRDFIDKVYSFVQNREIFTITMLQTENFEHEIFNLGFENIFYSTILRSSSKFLFRRLGGSCDMLHITYRKDYSLTITKLIEQILATERIINIYDVLFDLRNKYNVIMQDYKLKEIIKNTEIYYDDISENLYYDYDTYFDSI